MCSVGAGQTGSCSRAGVLAVSADCWRDDPSWPGGTEGGTAWSFGLDRKGHVKVSVHQSWLIGLISSNASLTSGEHLLLSHLLLLEEVLE